MTFAEWIKEEEQEEIRNKLKEQGYEETKEIRKFFNDRINCIFRTHYGPTQKLTPSISYERVIQNNREYDRSWFSQKQPEKKAPLDEDINFGEEEQKFFKKIIELFPTNQYLQEIENDCWEEVLSIEERQELFIIVSNMLEKNEYWIKINYSILGWKNTPYRNVEDALREKLLFPRMYRIRYYLLELKNTIAAYVELSGKEFIKKEQAFEVSLDRYVTVVDERAEKEKFAYRVNKKMGRVQQLLYGLNQEEEHVKDIAEITEEDKIFEADLDWYLNILDERKNGNNFTTRIVNKIEHIEKAWGWYKTEMKEYTEPQIVGQGNLKAIGEIEIIENEDTIKEYCKMATKIESDCQEDDTFEKNLKQFVSFVRNKTVKPN